MGDVLPGLSHRLFMYLTVHYLRLDFMYFTVQHMKPFVTFPFAAVHGVHDQAAALDKGLRQRMQMPASGRLDGHRRKTSRVEQRPALRAGQVGELSMDADQVVLIPV